MAFTLLDLEPVIILSDKGCQPVPTGRNDIRRIWEDNKKILRRPLQDFLGRAFKILDINKFFFYTFLYTLSVLTLVQY